MKFSSRGGEIDFIAPGESILSTYPGGKYHILSGTSMATPFVAGVAALIAAKHLQENDTETPLENNEDLREHLMRMAAHPGNHDSATGYGALTALGDFKTYDYMVANNRKIYIDGQPYICLPPGNEWCCEPV